MALVLGKGLFISQKTEIFKNRIYSNIYKCLNRPLINQVEKSLLKGLTRLREFQIE